MAAKLAPLTRLLSSLKKEKKKGKKVVFTNGCFDVLHLGHVRYLRKAKSLGDILVVGLNTDASVRKLKGPERPLNREKDRAEVLGALECVDHIVLFKESTPDRLIRAVRPGVLVKGGDWKKEEIVGSAFVESYGGKVRSLPFVDGFSTTGLIKRLQKVG